MDLSTLGAGWGPPPQGLALARPGLLWLLALSALPLLATPGGTLRAPWLALLPRDLPSRALDVVLRSAAALAIALLVLGLAGPYRPEVPVERIGTGAEIMLLLDRSQSMDQGFAGGRPGGRPGARESKGSVARRLLSEFAARRPADRFGMVVFSTLPMRVLGLTDKQEVVEAAIAAADIGRGLAETDIGLALQAALSGFEDRPYTGSRLVLLVSDGGDRIAPDMREQVARLARRLRVTLCWIYIRSNNAPSLGNGAAAAGGADDASLAPEQALHRYLGSIGVPYRVYEAENPQALQRAIDDVDRLERLPIVLVDVVPRRDLSPWCHGAALSLVLGLLAARLAEIRRWA